MIVMIICNVLSLILFIIYVCMVKKAIKEYEDREQKTINIIETLIASIGTQKSYIERNHLKQILEGVLSRLKRQKNE